MFNDTPERKTDRLLGVGKRSLPTADELCYKLKKLTSEEYNMAETATFKKKTVQNILQMNFKDDKTKVHSDAVFLFTEILRIFVAEGASRAATQAKIDGTTEVCIDQFEKVLPQLLLDM